LASGEPHRRWCLGGSFLFYVMSIKKIIYWAWLAALLVGPVVLFILPKEFFNEGIELCPSRILFQTDCLGCGMTRGVMHLLHFDFEGAAYYNILSFVALPFLIWLWQKWVRETWAAVKS
jgi:hypothetical protein